MASGKEVQSSTDGKKPLLHGDGHNELGSSSKANPPIKDVQREAATTGNNTITSDSQTHKISDLSSEGANDEPQSFSRQAWDLLFRNTKSASDSSVIKDDWIDINTSDAPTLKDPRNVNDPFSRAIAIREDNDLPALAEEKRSKKFLSRVYDYFITNEVQAQLTRAEYQGAVQSWKKMYNDANNSIQTEAVKNVAGANPEREDRIKSLQSKRDSNEEKWTAVGDKIEEELKKEEPNEKERERLQKQHDWYKTQVDYFSQTLNAVKTERLGEIEALCKEAYNLNSTAFETGLTILKDGYNNDSKGSKQSGFGKLFTTKFVYGLGGKARY